jgi:hypothetical protein
MSVNINLVARKNPDESKKDRIRKLKGISFAILIFTAFFAILIFAIDYRFSASYLKKQQADLLSDLSNYNEESAKVFVVNSKLTQISNILSQRKKYNFTVSQIAEKSNGSVVIEEFLINETGVTMTASANSLESADQFLNSMIELSDKKVLSSITLNKLAFASNKYIIELIIL